MNKYLKICAFGLLLLISSCANNNQQNEMMSSEKTNNSNRANILFLHHSTGKQILKGGASKIMHKLTGKGNVHKWFKNYNKINRTSYTFEDRIFPKEDPYGWNNYPFDYYNIWVKNEGSEPYKEEPTLEILTKKYDLIIFKHCFPVSRIIDKQPADINSAEKTLDNYKLQYNALKEKMHQFGNTKFIVWTGAALLENHTNAEQAKYVREFFNWVTNSWDEKGDNIFIWDFYTLETEGSLYLKSENAESANNSHPSVSFAKKVYPYFCQRIIDVINGDGDLKNITGIESIE